MGMESNRPPFSGAISVFRDGAALYEHAAGLADASVSRLITLETCFHSASASKQFVAASVMLLVEAGEVDLHAPIARYLPRCPAAWAGITTHQLLTHTAGFGHWRQVEGFDPVYPPTPAEILERRARRPLVHAPGSEFAYSGVGYLLAANIVERVAAQSYPEFTTQRVFAPLGMRATRAGARAPGAEALGYRDGEPIDAAGISAIPGTGELWTTVGDLTRYAAAFAADALLTASSRELMCTAHTPVPADDGQFGETVGYGYGYWIGTVDGLPMHYHPGDIVGYRSMYVCVSGARASIAILSNQDDTDASAISARLWTEHLADPVSGDAAGPAAGREGIEPVSETWELWRQDDNGNRFLVSVHSDEAAARGRMSALESGTVHKQHYWIKDLSIPRSGGFR
jgi:CubicO group peptidase (beta-lactamase class C family)